MTTDRKSVLIVEDEEAISWSLQRALNREGYAATTASSAEQALALAAEQWPAAVMLDVRLPGMDGLTALARLRERDPGLPVIVMTAYGTLDTAVRAVAAGASDYLLKPFDLQTAIDSVARATASLPRTANASTMPEPADPAGMVGASPVMQEVYKRIALAAPRSSCVLITGESGTGKELVARALHDHSPRRAAPFLPIHVAGLNPNLVESELFGHVRGAYTGASLARDGLLALADGGTVLLDEIGDVPLPIQVKLLRALEHDEIWPVGANAPRKVDVRLLAATHRDLGQLVAAGQFREDLFFRLNVFTIHLPPLRERRDDIPALAEHFLQQIAPQALPLSAETSAFLREQSWPGNVRELRNALEHAAIIAHNNALQPTHFPPTVAIHSAHSESERLTSAVRDWASSQLISAEIEGELFTEFLKTVEPALLEEVLRHVRGNRVEAARWLGLNRATVRKKLAQSGLDDPDPPGASDHQGESQRR